MAAADARAIPVFTAVPISAIPAALSASQPMSFLPDSLQGSPQPESPILAAMSPHTHYLPLQSQPELLLSPMALAHADARSSMPPRVHEISMVF